MILKKQFTFEASHRLPFHQGKCARLHGHSWILDVEVEGPLDPLTGMVLDFAEISEALKPIVESLDHHHLGTWERISVEFLQDWGVPWLPLTFNATCENLLWAIGERLDRSLPWSKLTLHETCTAEASLTKAEVRKGRIAAKEVASAQTSYS